MKLSQTVWAWRRKNREKMTEKKAILPFQQKNPSKKRCFSTPPTKNTAQTVWDNGTKPSQGERVYPQHAESLYFVTVGCRVPPLPPPQSGGNFFLLKNFNFCPLRGGRSRFSDFKHLFGVGELFEADISLLMFNSPPADRLAVICRQRRDIFCVFCRFRGFNGHLGGERVVQSSWCLNTFL